MLAISLFDRVSLNFAENTAPPFVLTFLSTFLTSNLPSNAAFNNAETSPVSKYVLKLVNKLNTSSPVLTEVFNPPGFLYSLENIFLNDVNNLLCNVLSALILNCLAKSDTLISCSSAICSAVWAWPPVTTVFILSLIKFD